MPSSSPIKVGLEISNSKLYDIIEKFQEKLCEGLRREGQMIKSLPTFIRRLPNGSELGEYLVVDLGGTNLRVGSVKLFGNGKFELDRKKWTLTDKVKHGDGYYIFEFIANCIKEYLQNCSHESLKFSAFNGRLVEFGFAFSYPVKQDGIAHGTLIQWSKSMTCNNVIGQDVVKLLDNSLKSIGMGNVKVAALLNDTVGTLVAHAYVDNDTKIGVILGTGTNAAYLETVSLIKKLQEPFDGGDGNADGDGGNVNNNSDDGYKSQDPQNPRNTGNLQKMIVNVEWGAFGDGSPEYLPLLPVDLKIDRESINPGKQLFEKLVSGMYLGEVARLSLQEFFQMKSLGKPFDFDTSDLSSIEEEDEQQQQQHQKNDSMVIRNIFKTKFSWDNLTLENVEQAKQVCKLVVKRSARLCAAAILALYRTMKSPSDRVVVAIDGSLYLNYPNYSNMIMETLNSLQPGHSMDLQPAKDESIVGAATVLAALKL